MQIDKATSSSQQTESKEKAVELAKIDPKKGQEILESFLYIVGTVNGIVANFPFPTLYPPHCTIIELGDTFEIKRWWMFNEWVSECQFSPYVQNLLPNREVLNPAHAEQHKSSIEHTFHEVRGKYALWGEQKEKATWRKIKTKTLELDWVLKNIKICFPTNDTFQVSHLDGLVLWQEAGKKKFRLIEGNHRVSAWKNLGTPSTLRATLYIGRV